MAEFRTEFLEWDAFLREFRWKQGQHMTLVAPTEGGKSTLAFRLIDIYRTYVLILASKNRDPLLDRLRKQGYREIRSMRSWIHDYPRHMLRPTPRSISDQVRAYEFWSAMDMVYRAGHMCIVADELVYLTDSLKLRREWVTLLRELRTAKGTAISMSQRPAWIPRECYSQATHIFFAKTTDKNDLDRISDITGGIDRATVRHDVAILRPFEWLWINRFAGTAYRIRMPKELV